MHGGPSIIHRHPVEKSNVELVSSLRTNILASQEAVVHASSWSAHGTKTPPKGAGRRPALSRWTSREDSTIYVPSVPWSSSGLAEERSQYDITVKLFFLPNVAPSRRRAHTMEAIDLVLRELKVPSIDLLILSFPGVAFDTADEVEDGRRRNGNGGCSESVNAVAVDASEADDMATMVKTWRSAEQLHAQGTVGKLGVAEFGSRRLTEFLKHGKVRPSVNQINVRNCCTVPRSLMAFAKREHIELLTHNDCTDILPSGTLRDLLGGGPDGVGFLANPASIATSTEALVGEVEPQWVVKYTAVVRDRGVVENKGYFAAADLQEHPSLDVER